MTIPDKERFERSYEWVLNNTTKIHYYGYQEENVFKGKKIELDLQHFIH